MTKKQKFLTARVEKDVANKIHTLRKNNMLNLSAIVRNFIRAKIEETNQNECNGNLGFSYISIALDDETAKLINDSKDKKINWSKEIREYLKQITK